MTTIAVTTRAAATAIAAHTQPESPDEDRPGDRRRGGGAGGTDDRPPMLDPGVRGGVDADAEDDVGGLDATELAGARCCRQFETHLALHRDDRRRRRPDRRSSRRRRRASASTTAVTTVLSTCGVPDSYRWPSGADDRDHRLEVLHRLVEGQADQVGGRLQRRLHRSDRCWSARCARRPARRGRPPPRASAAPAQQPGQLNLATPRRRSGRAGHPVPTGRHRHPSRVRRAAAAAPPRRPAAPPPRSPGITAR